MKRLFITVGSNTPRLFGAGIFIMDRLAQIGIIVQDISMAETVNDILHGFAEYIVGRMGLPYKKYSVMVISITIDAPADKINALTGKLAMLKGVTAKAIYANI